MEYEDKVNYLRIALSLQHIGVSNETADRIIQTYEKILEKEGAFSISDAVSIQFSLDKKYAEERLKNKSE